MTSSIRFRLLQAFFVVIFLMSTLSIGFFFMHAYIVHEYNDITDNMVSEYRLINDAAALISTYNERALTNTTFSATAQDDKIKSIKTDINNLTKVLDSTITDKQSVTDYIGLKNTINDVISEIDQGLQSIADNKADASTHYKLANHKYAFVKENGAALTFSELGYVASIEKQIDRTYQTSLTAGILSFALVSTCSILYALRTSKRIITPLSKLTATAQQISAGNMDAVIDPVLLQQQDEAGSLSNSFNLMFQRLKEKIHEVSVEKTGVERKVEERTAELFEEKVRLDASVNSLNVGFIMTDVTNNILMINPMARSILAYRLTADGVSKQDHAEVDRSWTFAEVDQHLGEGIRLAASVQDMLNSGKPVEYKAVNYNGRILNIFLAPILVADSANKKNLGCAILLQDITEEKVLERSKDEFFSIASHELRTPLTSIKGNSSMILDYYSEALKDEQLKEMVEDMHNSAVRLIEIVNDFLDVSRLEQGKMNFTYLPISVEKVVESVAYEMKQVLTEKKLHLQIDRLTLDTLPLIWADENRLKQVIYNLVGNAAKFTEQGAITVSAEVEGNFVKVFVSDTGRGMTPESQQLLFHKFQQASSSLLTRDTTRGTGLGLYISKMIVESMGGVIRLERSVENEGTVFSFTVPVATEEQKAALPPSVAVTDSTTGLTTSGTVPDTSPKVVT